MPRIKIDLEIAEREAYTDSHIRNEAKLGLANCYYYGRGTEEDNEAAFELYLELANEEYFSYRGKAMCQLAYCYKHGYGVEEDLEEAFYWFQKAAELGNKDAKEKLESWQ